MYVLPDLFLRERDIFFDGLFNDEFQVTFFCPLDRNKKLIQLIIDEPIEVLDDVRMV